MSTTHTYTTGGSFTVTLTVSDGILEDTDQADLTIDPPNAAPTASFLPSATTGQAPIEITFDASASSDPNGDALTFAWDFGDGESGSGVSTTHTYTTGGSFAVTLTVSDGILEDTATDSVVIDAPNAAPTASFTSSATTGQAQIGRASCRERV